MPLSPNYTITASRQLPFSRGRFVFAGKHISLENQPEVVDSFNLFCSGHTPSFLMHSHVITRREGLGVQPQKDILWYFLVGRRKSILAVFTPQKLDRQDQ